MAVDLNDGYGASSLDYPKSAVSLKQDFQRQKPFSQLSLYRARFPPPTNARNQLLDSSVRKSLIYMGVADDFCGLPCFWHGRAGETNAAERAKCSDFELGELVGKVRKNP